MDQSVSENRQSEKMTNQDPIWARLGSGGWLLLALLLVTALTFWVQWPRISDPFTFQDDFRKFHWMHRFQEPELFVDDPLTSSSVVEVDVGPWHMIVDTWRPGYSLLFNIASPLVSPIQFNKWLVFPLILIATYYLYRIGERIRGGGTGFALAILFAVINLTSPSSLSATDGLPRSFMLPILAALVYFLMVGRYWAAIITIAIGGAVYLPAMVLGLVTYGLGVLEPTGSRWRYRINRQRILPLLVLMAFIFLMIPPLISRLSGLLLTLSARLSTPGAMLTAPNYQSGGRLPLFVFSPFIGNAGIATKPYTFWLMLVLASLSVCLWLLNPRAKGEFPRTLKLLFWASWICFLFAWLAILFTSSMEFYFPSRYTRASVTLVLFIFVVVNIETGIYIAQSRLTMLQPRQGWLIAIVALLAGSVSLWLIRQGEWKASFGVTTTFQALILSLALTLLTGSVLLKLLAPGRDSIISDRPQRRSLSYSGKIAGVMIMLTVAFFVQPNRFSFHQLGLKAKENFSFIATLPKDALIAGNACSLNSVPLMAKRKVLISCEHLSSGTQPVALANLRAYYAERMSDVFSFCENYGVDYLLVQPQSFSRENLESGNIFVEPYNSIIYQEIKDRSSFVLEELPEEMRIYDQNGIYIMACESEAVTEDLITVNSGIEGLGLMSISMTPDNTHQDGQIEVLSRWVSTAALNDDYAVCFEVKGSNLESEQTQCQPLSTRLPTSSWPAGEIAYEDYSFRLSPYLKSDTYSIYATVIPVNDQGFIGEQMFLGNVDLVALPREFLATEELESLQMLASWENKIALTDLEVAELKDDSLDVAWHWLTLDRMDLSYKMYAHLIDAATGEIVVQVDSIPVNWIYPTNWWEENEIIADGLQISMADLSPGHYQLWLGLYNEDNGELHLDNPLEVEHDQYRNAIKIVDLER